MTWAVAVGTMIGSGIFMLPASLAPFGANAIAGWIVSGLGAVALAYCIGRLARAGGNGIQAYVEGLRPKLTERRFQVRAGDKQEIWARLHTVLGARAQQWALTGADAAERRTHFFRAEETEIYAPIRAFEDRDTQKVLIAQPAVRDGDLERFREAGDEVAAGV